MEIGIHSFGDTSLDPVTGAPVEVGKRLRETLDQVVLADQAALSFFGIGERHVPEFVISSPVTVLAEAASTSGSRPSTG